MLKRLLTTLGIAAVGFCEAQNYAIPPADAYRLPTDPQPSPPAALFRTSEKARQKLDSMVSKNYKEVYHYDAAGSHVLTLVYGFDTLSRAWGLQSKKEHAYDEIFKTEYTKIYLWDAASASYRPSYMHEVRYDASNVIIRNASHTYDTTLKEWIGSSKFETFTDIKGRPVKESSAITWDTVRKEWKHYHYIYSHYTEDTASHTQTKVQTYVAPADTQWYIKMKTVDYYDDANVLYQSFTYYLDSSKASAWKNSYKKEYTYGAEHKSILTSYWTGAEYKPENIQKFNYNAQGRTVNYENNYKWNTEASHWKGGHGVETPHDAQGNLLGRTLNDWDAAQQQFVGNSKAVHHYSFDIPKTTIQECVQLSNLPHFHRIDSTSFFNRENGTWVNTPQTSRYFYSTILVTASSNQVEDNSSLGAVFPNPSKGQVKIWAVQDGVFQLYTLQGSLLLNTPVQAQRELDLPQLPAGLYIYRMGTVRGTLMVEP